MGIKTSLEDGLEKLLLVPKRIINLYLNHKIINSIELEKI